MAGPEDHAGPAGASPGRQKPLSVPLISSWETQASPKIPPLSRLDAYAALFATRRSFTGDVPQPIEAADMTDAERQAMGEIKRELTQMRAQAMGATTVIGPEGYTGPEADRLSGLAASLNSGLWRFADGDTVTVVCAQFPKKFRAVREYTAATALTTSSSTRTQSSTPSSSSLATCAPPTRSIRSTCA